MAHVNIVELENGDLELSIANDADREELQELLDNDNFGYWSIMSELLEEYSTNGGYSHFDGGNGNPFVGLTSAPCIAESMDVLDDGENAIVGRFWYFGDYATHNEIGMLLKGERVIYSLAR